MRVATVEEGTVRGHRVHSVRTYIGRQWLPSRWSTPQTRPNTPGIKRHPHQGGILADAELRKTALFWLGQSEDPRALDLFEEILR